MNPNFYLRPEADRIYSSEIEIKRSRFLGFVQRAESEAQARDVIAALKSKYPDARHHCSAFIYHVEDSQPVERSSDDGEPSGTAGLPMLDVLRGSNMLDVVAVSVRYFGGVKLGTGGLVRAYSDSVSAALQEVCPVGRARRELYQVVVDHDIAGRVDADLRGRDFDLVDTEYGAQVTFKVGVEPGARDRLDSFLAETTQGRTEATLVGTEWIETH